MFEYKHTIDYMEDETFRFVIEGETLLPAQVLLWLEKGLTFNRRKKIYTLLSKRNRHRENASFFDLDGIEIKHIPQILSLLKTFSEHSIATGGIREDDEVKPLSIAYEIMRDWRMPELYYLDQMEED